MTEQNDMVQDIEVEVHHVISISTKTIIHTQNIVLQLEIDLVMTKIPLLHNTHDYNMTIIKNVQDITDHLTDPNKDLLLDVTLVPDIDHETTIFSRYTSAFRPPSRPRDSRSSRSRSHSNTRNKLNTIHPQTQNDPINFEVHINHTTEMANAVTPTSLFYYLYTRTPPNQFQRINPG